MLRNAVLAFGIVCLLGGALAWFGTGAGIPAMVIGAIIVLGIIFERVVYKPNSKAAPGPGWEKTSERFVDEQSGKPVTVYTRPETGERIYVEE